LGPAKKGCWERKSLLAAGKEPKMAPDQRLSRRVRIQQELCPAFAEDRPV